MSILLIHHKLFCAHSRKEKYEDSHTLLMHSMYNSLEGLTSGVSFNFLS